MRIYFKSTYFFKLKCNLYLVLSSVQFSDCSDRPRCRPNQKLVYGTEVQQQIRVLCDVDSNPPPVRFFWTFTRTGSSRSRSASLTTGIGMSSTPLSTAQFIDHAHSTLSNTLTTDWVQMKQRNSSDHSDDTDASQPTPTAIVLTHFTSSGHRSSLLYTPNTLDEFGQLSCEAENSVGRQSLACIFTVIPAGQ
jgi:hypothetical protein